MEMKFVVVGGGSMGKRRIRCLLANNIPPQAIRLVEVRPDRREEVKEKHVIDSFSDLESALDWNPSAVIVSVPGAYHMEVLLQVARAGKHFFCEVPLSINLDGIEALKKLVHENKLVAAPGCQTLFHPLFKQVKQWLADPEFGKLLNVVEIFGSYLPDWHPHEDYRQFYASDQTMGGGNIDVILQELNTLHLLTGDRIKKLSCRGSHISDLEIKGSDCWQIMGMTEQETAVTLQYDLINRAGHHSISFLSESGTIELDKGAKQVRRYLAKAKAWETFQPPADYVGESCYIDEIAHFLDCLRGDKQWYFPLSSAIDGVRTLMAMYKSDEQQVWMEV